VILRDLSGLRGPKVRRFRAIRPDAWWPADRELRMDPRFWTLLQESFYYYCVWTGVRFNEHRVLI
jgi:hypothetical protein